MPEDEQTRTLPRWPAGRSLAARILAVNILPLALLAGSFFYLDGFRSRLIRERLDQTANEARLIASAISDTTRAELDWLIRQPDDDDRVRFRLVDGSGRIVFDSWAEGQKGFLPDPSREASWERRAARLLDEAIDLLALADIPPPFPGFAASARQSGPDPRLTLSVDRTHIISVREAVPAMPSLSLVVDRNARDIRRLARSERGSLGIAVGAALLISVLLSLFLARTIVRPMRLLALAANAVRFGQAREVTVPRLPARQDEIGMLARAVSDMTHALRSRIDAIEAFAADVAHELKNPLASLRSAVETLDRVKDPAQQSQLLVIISNDVRRMDRLITEISELSRVDARLGRIRFGAVDLGEVAAELVAQYGRRADGDVRIAFARPAKASVVVHGDAAQLERVLANLLDNALSFSPAGGTVRIGATARGGEALLTVDDEGPGIPLHLREAVFERFHSDRPEGAFGQHSGLGLSIARAIVDAHSGSIRALDGASGKGTRMIVTLPLLARETASG